MSDLGIGFIGIGALFLAIFLRVPIAIAMLLVGTLGVAAMQGLQGGLAVLGTMPYSVGTVYTLTIIPLFIAMGQFITASGNTQKIYEAVNKWLTRLPGGLAIATVFSCALFAAMCGSSVATAAAMGSVTIPILRRYGYDDGLNTGSVAAAGTLGVMIPPSAGLVLYAFMAEQSVGKQLIAGILPGVLSALMYAVMIIFRCSRNPALAPGTSMRYSWKEKIASLKDIWSVFVVFGAVIGSIYLGVATPTEAAAAGAFACFLLFMTSKHRSLSNFISSLQATIKTTGMIMIIIIGAVTFSAFVSSSGVTPFLVNTVSEAGLPILLILMILWAFYLFLGMFLDGVAIVLLTVPIVVPIIIGIGLDPIWFGIVLIHLTEIALITPPVGLNCYVVAGIDRDIPLSRIFKGIFPFLIMDIVTLVLLTAFPQISLFMPNRMK